MIDSYKRKLSEALVKEWMAEGQSFYEQLVDGDQHKENIFKLYKERMDIEFICSEFKEIGIHLQDNWIQCPFCNDAWEANPDDEMQKCPTCSKIVLTPSIFSTSDE